MVHFKMGTAAAVVIIIGACATPQPRKFDAQYAASTYDGIYRGKAQIVMKNTATANCNAFFATSVRVKEGSVMWLQGTLPSPIDDQRHFEGVRGGFLLDGIMDGNHLKAKAGSYTGCMWNFDLVKSEP